MEKATYNIGDFYSAKDVPKLVTQATALFNFSDWRINDMLPSVWAEQNIYLSPAVSPARPGKFSYDYTPYSKEIVDCLSPYSDVNVVAVMKSSQCGITQGVIIPGILYCIAISPRLMLSLSGDKTLSKNVVEQRIDSAIDSANIRHLIKVDTQKKRNQRTGDTSVTKEFIGGHVIFGGLQNLGANMKQNTYHTIFLDDWESVPLVSKEGGDPFELVKTRQRTLGSRGKTFIISSPEVEQTSRIHPLYLRGDQRKWHVPCPCCGEYIDLQWLARTKEGKDIIIDRRRTGLIFSVESGKVIKDSIKYRCQKCGDEFIEKDKFDIMNHGMYIPTAIPEDESWRSYHISGLLAPKGQVGWYGMAQLWNKAYPRGGVANREKLRTFYNTHLGLPFKEIGQQIQLINIEDKKRPYSMSTVPDNLSREDGNGDIILITTAFDLNGLPDDARIDYEVVAWSRSGPSYSIEHGSIGTFSPASIRKKNQAKMGLLQYANYEMNREKLSYDLYTENSVWPLVEEQINKLYRKSNGEELVSLINLIDVGTTMQDEGGNNPRATMFVEKMYNQQSAQSNGRYTYGIKGEGKSLNKTAVIDPFFKKSAKIDYLYLLNVNRLKDNFSVHLSQQWNNKELPQPDNYCNFPLFNIGTLYGIENFFDHFTAEEKLNLKDSQGAVIKEGWSKKNSTVQNHFLDTRIYNIAAKEIATNLIVDRFNSASVAKLPKSWDMCCYAITGANQ